MIIRQVSCLAVADLDDFRQTVSLRIVKQLLASLLSEEYKTYELCQIHTFIVKAGRDTAREFVQATQRAPESRGNVVSRDLLTPPNRASLAHARPS